MLLYKKIGVLIIVITITLSLIINACLSGDELIPEKPFQSNLITSSSSITMNTELTTSSTESTNVTNFYTIPNKRKKFAILGIGTADTNTDYKNNLDPIDQNGCWFPTLKIYTYLKESGFKDENIYFLYCQGDYKPDFDDLRMYEVSQFVKEYHFSSKYNNEFSLNNISDIVNNKIIPKMDEESIFILKIIAHGTFMFGQSYIQGIGEASMLKHVLENIPSKRNLCIYMSCLSGSFKTNLSNFAEYNPSHPNNVLWTDNNFHQGESYIRNKIDMRNDTNHDGIVDYKEAFDATKKEAKDYEEYWRYYCENYYYSKTTECSTPKIYTPYNVTVGKDYIPFNLGE